MILIPSLFLLVLLLAWDDKYPSSHTRPWCLSFLVACWLIYLIIFQNLTYAAIAYLSITAILCWLLIGFQEVRLKHRKKDMNSSMEEEQQTTHLIQEQNHREKTTQQAIGQLQNQLERTSDVYKATLQMSSTLDFNETLATFISSLANLEGFIKLHLILSVLQEDSDEETLTTYHFRAENKNLEKTTAVPHEEVLFERCKDERRIQTVTDGLSFGLLPGTLEISEDNSALLIPLYIQNEYNGILVYFNHEHVYHQQLELLSLHFAMEIKKVKLYHKIKRLSIIDSLSGTYLRTQFESMFSDELERHQNQKSRMAVCMVDIDQFKNINDQHGHLPGDSVIRKVAWVIKSRCREEDLICRYGGDEFIIVFPKTDLEKAMDIAERIRKAISELLFLPQESREIRVTVSIGISIYPLHGKTQNELLESADRALYRAKNEGRNQVITEPLAKPPKNEKPLQST